MKYLLKTDYKQNNTVQLKIALKNTYNIYDSLRNVITYLFENSAFIKSYEIYILQDFEPDNTPNKNNSVMIDSPSAEATFL